MPFCPSCEFEYRRGVRTCPDCGVELVERLPPRGSATPRAGATSQVVLGTVLGEIHAKLVGDALAARGIRFRIQRCGPVPWLGLPSVGGEQPIRIHVDGSDLALARIVLGEFEGFA